MTLKELEIGDKFYNINDKAKKVYIVRGNPCFNFRHGSPTRACVDVSAQQIVSKSCKIEVVKTGESKFKEQMKLKPVNIK